ncbi:FadR/GntR family transcriptional regulator [Arenibacterium sp. CAU 1754]
MTFSWWNPIPADRSDVNGGAGVVQHETRNRAKERPQNRPTLVAGLAKALRDAIAAGEIAIGEKLPSEAALTVQYGVSRTVVREAIASLRADGLVEARQGAGVFVLASVPPGSNPFQNIDYDSISSIIEMLELRTAIEVEAAALAAVRRSPAQEDAIYERLDAFERALLDGGATGAADLAFHVAIAGASNNPRFGEFLEMLGRAAIPRDRLHKGAGEAMDPEYLAMLQGEHRQIADAISARDEEGARAAMRCHLQGAQRRYRQLLRRK